MEANGISSTESISMQAGPTGYRAAAFTFGRRHRRKDTVDVARDHIIAQVPAELHAPSVRRASVPPACLRAHRRKNWRRRPLGAARLPAPIAGTN